MITGIPKNLYLLFLSIISKGSTEVIIVSSGNQNVNIDINEIESLLTEGKKSIIDDELDEAYEKYQSAFNILSENEDNLNDDPKTFSELLNRIGQGLLKVKEYEKAIEAYDLSLELDEDNISAWRNKGKTYRNMVDMEDYALFCYNEILNRDPENKTALFNKVETLQNLGREEEMEESLKRLLDISPSNISYLHKLVKKYPNDPKLWRLEAERFQQRGKTDKAIKSYNKVLNLLPDDEGAKEKLRELQSETEEPYEEVGEEALEEKVEESGKLIEGVSEESESIGEEELSLKEEVINFIEDGEEEAALDRVEEVIKKYPEDEDLIDNLLEIDPENINLLRAKAENLEKEGQKKKALKYYNRIHDADPEDMAYFDKALEINPDNVQILRDKLEALMKLENYEEALEVIDSLIDMNESNEEILLKRGICLYHLEELDDAVEELNEVVKKNSDNSKAWAYKAKIAARQQNLKMLRPLLKRAVNLDNEFIDEVKKDKAFKDVRDSEVYKEIID